MTAPTIEGFTAFVRGVMAIDAAALPDNSPMFTYAFSLSMAIVDRQLALVGGGVPGGWTIYELAVYNLGGDRLVTFAPDNPPSTFFTDLRATMKLGNFVAGVVSSTFDQGTGESMVVSDWMKNMTLMDLQNLKTPWGRAYLMFAQMSGSLWGIS